MRVEREIYTRVLAVILAASLAAGCAGISHRGGYASQVRHEPLPLRATVTVVVDPTLRKDWNEDRLDQLESLRQGFQEALQQDLAANGPITPSADRPEARMVVTLQSARGVEWKLYFIIWFLSPLWLLGVPIWKGRVSLKADLQLSSLGGEPLYRISDSAECTQHEGVYYGHRELDFGCAAQRVAEAFRDRLSANRAEILGRVARATPVAPPPREVERERVIAVVFPVRDMTGMFEPVVLAQTGELLATQLTAQLGLRVTGAAELSGQLEAAKVDTYRECFDRSCQIELGKALAANKAVATTLLRFGPRCSLAVTVLDLKAEATERAASFELGCEVGELPGAVMGVVQRLQAASPAGGR
jgi:hypothetical protein